MEGYVSPIEEETLVGIMCQIQDFLNACYYLGVNPLRELRQILPQYTWKYVSLKNHNSIKEVVTKADFIWRVNWIDDGLSRYSDTIQLVTATKSDRVEPNHSWFYGEECVNLPETSNRQVDFIEAFDGNPVYSVVISSEDSRTPEGEKYLMRNDE